jgi:uncharacterized membrane protein YdfJ with MMPL/SSD domain
MREQPRRHEQISSAFGTSWIDWAAHHPGIVLLGTLVVAILALSGAPKPEDTTLDSSGEEVPLFI